MRLPLISALAILAALAFLPGCDAVEDELGGEGVEALNGDPAPSPDPVEPVADEPARDPYASFVLPEPPVEIIAGPCGNGIINDGEQCDCRSVAPAAQFCLDINGPDNWCGATCQASCVNTLPMPCGRGPNVEEIAACETQARCSDRLNRITSARARLLCPNNGNGFTPAQCDAGHQAQLALLDSDLAAQLARCRRQWC